MRGKDLLDQMELVAPEYVEAADKAPKTKGRRWVKWGAMAACFCLVAAAAAVLLPKTAPASDQPTVSTPSTAEPAEESSMTGESGEPWTAYFNEMGTFTAVDRIYSSDYFTEELSDRELAAVLPGKKTEWMEFSGYAGFIGEGELVEVCLHVTTSIPETPVTVIFAEDSLSCDLVYSEEPVVSVCGAVEYTVFQYSLPDSDVSLVAYADINGHPFMFSLDAMPQDLEQAKADFSQVLARFASYEEGKPDLTAVTAEVIPERFELALSLAEAQNDADFGRYMLQSVPEGFTEEGINRTKSQHENSLSGAWTRNYDELRWCVEAYDESDAARLTSVADRQNYDLSLYPIPRYESLPEELRLIVDHPIFLAEELTLDTVYARAYRVEDSGDSDGWRMNFSVKYGGIVVSVSTKGVEPEWVYEQLMGLRDK